MLRKLLAICQRSVFYVVSQLSSQDSSNTLGHLKSSFMSQPNRMSFVRHRVDIQTLYACFALTFINETSSNVFVVSTCKYDLTLEMEK